MTEKTLKELRLPRRGGDDILTIVTNPEYQWAAVIEVQQGNQCRFETHAYRTEKSARACITRELKRYDELNTGASGALGQLVEVAE
jgi:hypothetical protein